MNEEVQKPLSNEELAAIVSEKNAIIANGTAQQKRVLIAQEVLQVLDTINVKEGIWLEMPTFEGMKAEAYVRQQPLTEKEFQERMKRDEILAGCNACAVGVTCVATARLFDSFSPSLEFWQTNLDGTGVARMYYDARGNMAEYLEQYFYEEQIQAIEAAFECGEGMFTAEYVSNGEYKYSMQEVECECSCGNLHTRESEERSDEYDTPEWWNEAVAFGEKYETPRDRLKAIMENIIANGGEFCP